MNDTLISAANNVEIQQLAVILQGILLIIGAFITLFRRK